jgi:hypothetical protein
MKREKTVQFLQFSIWWIHVSKLEIFDFRFVIWDFWQVIRNSRFKFFSYIWFQNISLSEFISDASINVIWAILKKKENTFNYFHKIKFNCFSCLETKFRLFYWPGQSWLGDVFPSGLRWFDLDSIRLVVDTAHWYYSLFKIKFIEWNGFQRKMKNWLITQCHFKVILNNFGSDYFRKRFQKKRKSFLMFKLF